MAPLLHTLSCMTLCVAVAVASMRDEAAALVALEPPACTNLTGWWCCDDSFVTQTGYNIFSEADYGNGTGIIAGNTITMNFTDAPDGLIVGTVNAACDNIQWDNGAVWTPTTGPVPWFGPSTAPPPWCCDDLVIYQINPRVYTSPAGAGDGGGSGTWASLTTMVPYLQQLGVNGIWLAGYCVAQVHFYGIWTVYATEDPTTLDPVLGPEADFQTFIDTAHAAGIYVFLDAITHGIMNGSALLKTHPEYFLGGSWGMTDYNYLDPGMQQFWVKTWLSWVTRYGVDGFRLDDPETSVLPPADVMFLWDNITEGAIAAGHPILVFAEGAPRYHFSQDDYRGLSTMTNLTAAWTPSPCYATFEISCHDNGWESGPGNYFTIQGSRAWMGYAGIFSFNIPLWLGGEEYNESPVVHLPNLTQGLYGDGGPGGWMYGSVRQWSQLNQTSQADMLADTQLMMALARQENDVVHRNRCRTNILSPAFTSNTSTLGVVPYIRYNPGLKAILVVGNTDNSTAASVSVSVSVANLGMASYTSFNVTDLWLTGASKVMSAAALTSLSVSVGADNTPRGGLGVVKIVPIA